MIRCKQCGRENADGAKYCGDCGTALAPSTGPSTPVAVADSGGRASLPGTCPSCGWGLLPGRPFCPACGTRVTPVASGPACASCGVPAAPGAKFCASCGRSLTEPKRDSQTSSLGAARGTTRAELALLDEAGAVQSRHALRGEDTTVGRADADIRFADDPFLSPLHAQVSVRDGHFYVRDLGSRNGTWYFLEAPYRMQDGDLVLVGSQVLRFRRLGYPGPHPPEHDATRRLGSLIPSADIASLTQLRSDGSPRDVLHLSPGREIVIGRETGDWIFPYDPSMSGTHARVRSEDADFVVVDEGSRNGIAVSVRGEVEIAPGSRFLVGDKMLRLETP